MFIVNRAPYALWKDNARVVKESQMQGSQPASQPALLAQQALASKAS